jgi:hypothetical protein
MEGYHKMVGRDEKAPQVVEEIVRSGKTHLIGKTVESEG